MPGGRESLTYIETKKLRLAPLGSYLILRCVCGTEFPIRAAKIK